MNINEHPHFCARVSTSAADTAIEVNKAEVTGMLQCVIQVIRQYMDFVCIDADPDVIDDTMEVNATETGEHVGQLYMFVSM